MMSPMRPSATDMIRMDHTHVQSIFHRYKGETDPKTKQGLAEMICLAIEVHAALEEEIFYPAMREVQADRPVVEKSYPEHDEIKRLIARVRETEPADPAYDRALLDLMRDVLHHVADEETTLLPDAEASLGQERLKELGARMTRRRMALMAPAMPQMARSMVRATPTAWLVGAAGLLVGVGLLTRRAYGARA